MPILTNFMVFAVDAKINSEKKSSSCLLFWTALPHRKHPSWPLCRMGKEKTFFHVEETIRICKWPLKHTSGKCSIRWDDKWTWIELLCQEYGKILCVFFFIIKNAYFSNFLTVKEQSKPDFEPSRILNQFQLGFCCTYVCMCCVWVRK